MILYDFIMKIDMFKSVQQSNIGISASVKHGFGACLKMRILIKWQVFLGETDDESLDCWGSLLSKKAG